MVETFFDHIQAKGHTLFTKMPSSPINFSYLNTLTLYSHMLILHCSSLFSRPQFHLLGSPAFFNAVHVDSGGYGISWSDDIDLSEYELWTNSKTATDKSLKTDVAKSCHAA